MYSETDYAESDPDEDPLFIILQQNISLYKYTLKHWKRVYRSLTVAEVLRYNIPKIIKQCKKDVKTAINKFMNY